MLGDRIKLLMEKFLLKLQIKTKLAKELMYKKQIKMIGVKIKMLGDKIKMLGDKIKMLGGKTKMLGDRIKLLMEKFLLKLQIKMLGAKIKMLENIILFKNRNTVPMDITKMMR